MAGGRKVERLVGRSGFLELPGPDSLEVNGVGQDEPGEVGEAAGRQDVLDLVLGLLRHPMVDLVSGCLRSGPEVSLMDVSLVFALGDLEKSREQGRDRKSTRLNSSH